MQYKKPWNWSWSWLKKKRKKDQSKHVMLRGRRTIPIQRQRRSPFRFVFTWKQIWAIRNALTIVRGCGCISNNNNNNNNNNNGTWLGLTYKCLWLFLGLTKHQTAIHEGKTCKVQQKKKKKKKKILQQSIDRVQDSSIQFKFWDLFTRHTKRQCTWTSAKGAFIECIIFNQLHIVILYH